MDPYKLAGVDIDAGDHFSSAAAKVCLASRENSPFVTVHDQSNGNFRGLRGYSIKGLRAGWIQTICPDGIGTKVGVITAGTSQITAGYDLVAMTADDAAVKGACPIVMSNVLDVATLGDIDTEIGRETNQLLLNAMVGLGAAAKEAQIVLLNGETAELGVFVGSEDPNAKTKFNWAGFVHAIYYTANAITGNTIKEGMSIMALREYGPRSNWLSAIRQGLQIEFGNEWYDNPKAKDDIRAASLPSQIYTPLLTKLHGWGDDMSPLITIHGAAHITGGGFEGKLGKDLLFPRGLSAELQNLWEIPKILLETVARIGSTAERFYAGSSAGNGCLVIIDNDNETEFIDAAKTMGFEARWCGRVTKMETPQLHIWSGLPGSNDVFYDVSYTAK